MKGGEREMKCENCRCNRVCDHNRFGFENCDCYIPEWISVEERLPDPKEYDWVLVNVMFNEDGTYGVPCVAEYKDGQWWNGEYFLEDLWLTVTHWMPFPEPPKKEGE